jgi:hypothetical protein
MGSETIDRRLIMRVLANWRSLSQDGKLPRRSQIDPQVFGRDWSSCLLIDVDPVVEHSRLAYVGDLLRDPTWPPFERQRIADCLEDTLLPLATSKLPMVMSQHAPVSHGGSATYAESPIMYRCILLPLSEDGTRIDGILGAISYREVATEQAIHDAKSAMTKPEKFKPGTVDEHPKVLQRPIH